MYSLTSSLTSFCSQVYSNDDIAVKVIPSSVGSSLFSLLECALTQRENALLLLDHYYPQDCEPKHLKGSDRWLYEMLLHHFQDEYKLTLTQLNVQVTRHSYEGRDGTLYVKVEPEEDLPNSTYYDFSFEQCDLSTVERTWSRRESSPKRQQRFLPLL